MNTKFTKGPWRVRGDESVMVFADAGLEHIAACVTEDLPLSVRQANAALIATATEMYAELKQAAECISDLSQGKGGWDYEGVIQGIEALLEKARGEA